MGCDHLVRYKADEENLLSPMETETEQHMCAYLWAGEHNAVHFERPAKLSSSD